MVQQIHWENRREARTNLIASLQMDLGPQRIREEVAPKIGWNAEPSEQNLVCDESDPKKDPEGENNENSEIHDDVDKLTDRSIKVQDSIIFFIIEIVLLTD